MKNNSRLSSETHLRVIVDQDKKIDQQYKSILRKLEVIIDKIKENRSKKEEMASSYLPNALIDL